MVNTHISPPTIKNCFASALETIEIKNMTIHDVLSSGD